MPQGSMPNFAFLLLREHPYGREMFRQLVSSGFVPKVIISEESEVGDEERDKFLKRIAGRPVAPEIEVQLACLLYTSPSPRDLSTSRMPSSA